MLYWFCSIWLSIRYIWILKQKNNILKHGKERKKLQAQRGRKRIIAEIRFDFDDFTLQNQDENDK